MLCLKCHTRLWFSVNGIIGQIGAIIFYLCAHRPVDLLPFDMNIVEIANCHQSFAYTFLVMVTTILPNSFDRIATLQNSVIKTKFIPVAYIIIFLIMIDHTIAI